MRSPTHRTSDGADRRDPRDAQRADRAIAMTAAIDGEGGEGGRRARPRRPRDRARLPGRRRPHRAPPERPGGQPSTTSCSWPSPTRRDRRLRARRRATAAGQRALRRARGADRRGRRPAPRRGRPCSSRRSSGGPWRAASASCACAPAWSATSPTSSTDGAGFDLAKGAARVRQAARGLRRDRLPSDAADSSSAATDPVALRSRPAWSPAGPARPRFPSPGCTLKARTAGDDPSRRHWPTTTEETRCNLFAL